jgi:hypothetical protein
MSTKRILIITAVCLLVLLVSVFAWLKWSGSASQETGRTTAKAQQGLLPPEGVLLMDVLRFRQQIFADASKALADNATPEGQAALKSLGQELWQEVSADAGWTFLTQTSVAMVGATAGEQALSAFYNPWADVFLLLEWSRQGGRWKISDADIAIGDWFRKVGEEPVETQPLWLRGNERRSGALAKAVADSAGVFDALFPADATAAGWRALLKLEQPEPGRSLNRSLASVNIAGVLLNVSEFSLPGDSESPRLPVIRNSVEQIRAAMASGKMADVLASAVETEPVQREALLKIDPGALKETTPIFHIPAPGGQKPADSAIDTVFLMPIRQLDFCLSLSFSGNPATLKRVVLVPFAAVVEAAQKRKGETK